MLGRILFVVGVCASALLSAHNDVQGQGPDDLSLFLRIDGVNSIDSAGQILLPTGPGSYFGEVIVRETVGSGTALLGDSPGLTSVNFLISASGGATFSGENSGFGAGDQSVQGQIKGIGIAGPKPKIQIATGVFEAVAGTFNIQFDGTPASFSFDQNSPSADDFGVFTDSLGPRVLDTYFTNFNSPILLTTAAVPEPTSLAMVGTAVLAMIRRRRR